MSSWMRLKMGSVCSAWGKGLSSALAIGAGLLCASSAWSAVELRIRATPIEEPVRIFATVTDANGDLLLGLTEADFTVLENGTEQTITSFTPPAVEDANAGVSVAFVMDYSGSISNRNGIQPMEDAVVSFINAMELNDYAAIVKFNGNIGNALPFTQVDPANTTALVEAAQTDFPFANNSRVYDAVAEALNLIAQSTLPDGPKAIVLLTDGTDLGSTITLNELIDMVAASNVPIFTVAFGAAGTNVLNTLAQVNNGQSIATADPAALAGIYQEIATLLQNEYQLTYESEISTCDQARLEVLVQAGQAGAQGRERSFTRCPSTNNVPTISPPEGRTYRVGTPVELPISAMDVDGDPLSFSAAGLPTGLSLNPDTGVITGTPSETGLFNVRIAVSDGTDTNTVAFTAEVLPQTAISTGGGGGGGGGLFGYLELLLLSAAGVLLPLTRRKAA